MALHYFTLYRVFNRNVNAIGSLLRFVKTKTGDYRTQDPLDVYTNNLIQQKYCEWSDFMGRLPLLSKSMACTTLDKSHLIIEDKLTIEHCTKEEFLNKVQDYLLDNNISSAVYILENYTEHSLLLPNNFIHCLMRIFARLGHLHGLEVTQSLIKTKEPIEFDKKNGFTHFTAQVLWYHGHYGKSLGNLEKICKVKRTVTAEVKFVLYDIISDVITKRGEAALVQLTNFVKKIAMDFRDLYPMAMLWRKLYESEWFADQELARSLLEEHESLIHILEWMIPFWCTYLINNHKIDTVHRLCEILLAHNFLNQYSLVLHNLFEYHYKNRDLRRCSAVVRSAADLNIVFKESCQKRFVQLLISTKQINSKEMAYLFPKG